MINKAALERLRSAPIRGEKVAKILEDLAAGLEIAGAKQTHVNLDYQVDDNVKPGELIPYIVIGLRQA